MIKQFLQNIYGRIVADELSKPKHKTYQRAYCCKCGAISKTLRKYNDSYICIDCFNQLEKGEQ